MDRNGSVMAPGRSTAVLVCRKQAEYVNRMDQPEGDRSDGGSRTRLQYSEYGKAVDMGKQRGRWSCWFRETFPAHSEVGEECPHNWTRSRRTQSRLRSYASRR